jgi:hypothetical protein
MPMEARVEMSWAEATVAARATERARTCGYGDVLGEGVVDE